MTTSRQPDEALENYRDQLGIEFGTVFHHAYNEWCNLAITWNQFERLFGHSRERVQLINKAGRAFFFQVERHFFAATVLAVCRLCDPKKVAHKDTLTVMSFDDFMDTPARQTEMKRLLAEVKVKTRFHRDWRNRHLAHNDLKLKTGVARKLKTGTRDKMNKAIEALHDVFAYIGLEHLNTHYSQKVIPNLENEMVLLRTIYGSVEVRDRELEEIKASGFKARRERPDWLEN